MGGWVREKRLWEPSCLENASKVNRCGRSRITNLVALGQLASGHRRAERASVRYVTL
jgi:hypothetical protein